MASNTNSSFNNSQSQASSVSQTSQASELAQEQAQTQPPVQQQVSEYRTKYKLNLKREFFPHLPKKHYALAGPLPDKKDLRDKFCDIFQQGSIGSCSANALSAAFYVADDTVIGSRLFLYYNERALDLIDENGDNGGDSSNSGDSKNDDAEEIEDSGASLSSGIKALSTFGICLESMYPYILDQFSSRPPFRTYVQALKHRVIVSQQLSQNLYSLKSALSAGLPIVFGFDVHESFMSEDTARTGVVNDPQPGEETLGGHAVVICGYDDTVTPKIFIVRNSWGDGWGDKGYCYFSQNFVMTNNCTDFWTIKSVTKDEKERKMAALLDENINVEYLKNATDERPQVLQ